MFKVQHGNITSFVGNLVLYPVVKNVLNRLRFDKVLDKIRQ